MRTLRVILWATVFIIYLALAFFAVYIIYWTAIPMVTSM